MANLADLFNPGGAEVKPQNTDLYRVSYKEGKNGVYKSIIRFVPFYADPVNKSIVSKSVAYVKNPISGNAMYIDDPKSIHQPSIISEAFFKLWNTKIATYQDIAKKFLSSREQYASLVQIIEDEQHPELKGQIKVFTYGKKLWQKIYDEQHPVAGQGSNPFHPSQGRYFALVCTAQQEFNNYDQSQFFDYKGPNGPVPMGMWYINAATGQLEVVTDNTDPQALMDYLAANSPDLSKYDYQPWTDDQTKFVNETVNAVLAYATNGGAQNNLQALNTPVANPVGTLQVNAAPVFPGVGAVATSPVAPVPVQAPVASVPSSPVAPAPAPVFGSVSIGESSVGGSSGSIAGVQLPNVAPAAAPAPAAQGGLGINVSDILANL